MNAVIYCRVSDPRQEENLSLPTQEKACRDHCLRAGYQVDRVFIKRGHTAKTTTRPEFLAMLKYCRERRGQVHAVVVYALTRFSRNTLDHHTTRAHLLGLGIALRSVTENLR
jgi:site-specific DNA recombinase